MKELSGRVAVVTGAASGIGRGLADRFAEEGMKVVLADVDAGALERAVAELTASGAEAIGVRTDVTDVAQIQALADRTIEAFGAVHVLCNNAGVESGGMIADIPEGVWDWVLDVNVAGVVHGCRIFLPLIREQGEGHIVNTGSVGSFITTLPTFAPYIVSKFAVLALSECIDIELGITGDDAIGVSLLAPGAIKTQIAYAERNLPEDVPAPDEVPLRREVIDGLRARTRDGMEPAEVAEHVVNAIREQRFFILTHPSAAIDAMNERLEWMRTGQRPESRRPYAS